ncbi:hypothetical protein PCANC_21495 [Puccinia coronata f. sp. avenae]|uniref:Endonuclease/exonuclease/phosphatase domain-containing protein n=1 Tax=Puccinia coronata f. sp. avenae TaxID=200324 RepID=A0A2N5S8B4_9BASI|nr:hypothetical protein PCANC_21495 [Puccinia coronata f. sp. avenae]
MLPALRPPNPSRDAPATGDSDTMDDLEVRLPPRPITQPPASSLHICLAKALGKRDANGSVLLDAKYVDLLLELLANNERMIHWLEATIDQLNAKVNPLVERMAEFEKLLKTGLKPAPAPGKSFASANLTNSFHASSTRPGIVHAPTTRPPPKQVLALLKPKRVITHSNPANTTLKDIPSAVLVQKANETLLGLEAQVDGEYVAVRGVSKLPSGDVSFYTKNKAHQKWLMDNKHVWSKVVHPDLEATPGTYSVMAHGVPKSFDIGRPTNLALLASKNNFQATDLAWVRWMVSDETLTKKAGSLVLAFTNKDLAYRVEKSGIFLNYDYHRTEQFKPWPPQCFKCLRMGHFGKWCREPARCAKCAGTHTTNECPKGIGGVKSMPLQEGMAREETPPLSMIDTTFETLVHPPYHSLVHSPSQSSLSSNPLPDPTSILRQDLASASTHPRLDPNSLSLIQLNCHVQKSVTLSLLNSALSFDFLLLQEPWINSINLCPPQHQAWRVFAAYEHSPTCWNERHKAVIYVRCSIPSKAIRLLEGGSQNMVGVEVTQTGKVFRLLNIYNPPSSFSLVDELKSWLTTFYSLQQAVVISMDANLHHGHWNPPGTRKTEPEARTLLSTLSLSGFWMVSPKHVPMFYSSKGRGSTIDLVWANFLGSKLVRSASVSCDNFGSDHQAILVQLLVDKPIPTYHWRQPLWSELDGTKQEQIAAKLRTMAAETHTDSTVQVEQLTSFLIHAQRELGRRVQSNQAKAKPWWCRRTLDPVLRERNRARRWMLLAKSQEAFECYRQWNDYFLSLVDSLKRRSWRRLLEDPAAGDLYRVLRFSLKSAGGEVLPLKDPGGTIVHNKHKQAELLFKGTSVTNVAIDLSDVPADLLVQFVSYPPVSTKEVAAAIRRISPKKAPGIDGLANKLLKSLYEPLLDTLTNLYNNILLQSSFPAPWKIAVTTIIRKHGKPDYTNPSAY